MAVKILTRRDKVPLKSRIFKGVKQVSTAGYMPVAQRIDRMIRAGVQISGKPLFQTNTSIPLDKPIQGERSVHNTLETQMLQKETVQRAIDAQEKLAVEALKRSAIDEYIKSHQVSPTEAVAPPPDAT